MSSFMLNMIVQPSSLSFNIANLSFRIYFLDHRYYRILVLDIVSAHLIDYNKLVDWEI